MANQISTLNGTIVGMLLMEEMEGLALESCWQ